MMYKNKTVKRHARGNWYARVRFGGKLISVYGKTQAEAYTKLKALCDSIEQQKFELSIKRIESIPTQATMQEPIAETKTANTYTLQEWFNEWLNSYKVGNVRATTIDHFKKDFKYLQDLHQLLITDITNLMLSKAINSVNSYRQRDKVDNLCKQLFKTAFYNKLIDVNPAHNLPRPKQTAKTEKQAFTQEQEKHFIEICMKDSIYEPFLICLLQGIRKGEMLALRPNDFDFDNNILRIDESYDCCHPDDLQTKNESSNRKMPMFELTKQTLLKYRNYPPNDRIYIISDNGLHKRLAKLYKNNPGLPRLTVHELRHTFISRCHEKGIDELIVQKWVGHAKGSRMTKAVYTHIGSDAEQRYIDLINNIIT